MSWSSSGRIPRSVDTICTIVSYIGSWDSNVTVVTWTSLALILGIFHCWQQIMLNHHSRRHLALLQSNTTWRVYISQSQSTEPAEAREWTRSNHVTTHRPIRRRVLCCSDQYSIYCQIRLAKSSLNAFRNTMFSHIWKTRTAWWMTNATQ